MPLPAQDVIDRTSRTIYDKTNVRWPELELLDYANDAVNQLVLVRPDINAKTVIVALEDGTYQTVPTGGIRLLRVTRNMVGATVELGAGDAIREAYREALDSEHVGWHKTETEEIEHYLFDNVNPTVFYVYPGSKPGSTVYVELIYSAEPTKAATAADNLDVPSVYINPIYDWVLQRAYSKDAEYAGNPQRAERHERAFYNSLGLSLQSGTTASTDPNRPPGQSHG